MEFLENVGIAVLPYVAILVAGLVIYLLLHYNPEFLRQKNCTAAAGTECPPNNGLVVLFGLMISILLQMFLMYMF